MPIPTVDVVQERRACLGSDRWRPEAEAGAVGHRVGITASGKISALRPRIQHMTDTRAAFGKALSWHCTSVFVTDSESSNYGAILHGFDGRSGKPLDVYTEATGYAISLFHFLARTRGDAPLLAMAKEAAQFLMRIQAG